MPTLTTVADWTITASGDTADFTYAAADAPGVPRVWSGRGLAIAEADLARFDKALGEVLKLPVYWLARARRRDAGAGEAAVWSAPRYDPADAFVYVTGPCRAAGPDPGYRPVSTFAVELVHLRGLRIRVAAYLAAAGGRQRISAAGSPSSAQVCPFPGNTPTAPAAAATAFDVSTQATSRGTG
jgi:hypothetical protein